MSKRAQIEPGDGDPRHGTPNGYVNLSCRCDACRLAHTTYTREVLRPRRYRLGFRDDDPRHGSENFYTNYGCRCIPCTTAKRRARQVGAR